MDKSKYKPCDLKKIEQLGMFPSTALGKLRKMVIFNLLERLGENYCYRCGKLIESFDDLTIDHKKRWLHGDVSLYWDLNNVAFSHYNCNSKHKRHTNEYHKGVKLDGRATVL